MKDNYSKCSDSGIFDFSVYFFPCCGGGDFFFKPLSVTLMKDDAVRVCLTFDFQDCFWLVVVVVGFYASRLVTSERNQPAAPFSAALSTTV